MTKFVRSKILSQYFSSTRLIVTECDLNRLACVMAKEGAPDGLPIEIEVSTADGEDTYFTADPEFFLSPDMPRGIRKISISSSYRETGIMLKVDLGGDGFLGRMLGASVLAAGQDTKSVVSAFHEIVRILNECQAPDAWMFGTVGRLVPYTVIGAIVAATTYGLDRLLSHLLAPHWSPTGAAGDYFMSLPILLIFVAASSTLLLVKFHQFFPRVEFAGKLIGTGARQRARVSWIAMSLLLPITTNLAAWAISLQLGPGR